MLGGRAVAPLAHRALHRGLEAHLFLRDTYDLDLFNATVDPYQRTNLADDPRYASMVTELDALTTQLKSDAQ